MKRAFGFLSLLCLLTLVAYSQSVAETDYVGLNTTLSGHLKTLNDVGVTSRVWGGVITGGAGAFLAVSGAYVATDPYYREVGIGVATVGAAIGALSLLFLIPTKSEEVYRTYSSLPESSEKEVKLKAQKGERALHDLSDESRNGRFISAGSNTALGAFYLLYQPSLLGAAVLGSGIAGFFIESMPEHEFKVYSEEKQNLKDQS